MYVHIMFIALERVHVEYLKYLHPLGIFTYIAHYYYSFLL